MPKDNPFELFYLVDTEDQVLGSIERQIAHRGKKQSHRSIFIIIFNEKGELLLQKRSNNKDTFPGFWTVSVSGHVAYGQSYDQAAKREMREEVNLDLILKRIEKIYIEEEKEFAFIYKASCSSQIFINFDRDEIEKMTWVSFKKLDHFIKDNQLTPSALKVLQTIDWRCHLM